MKVIFLDMDGVLCTPRSHEAYGGQGLMMHLDPIAVKLVERLAEQKHAKIVLSSSWRDHFDRVHMTGILQNSGMANVPWHQNWKTPSTRMTGSRGTEIKQWMETSGGTTLHKYVILDDQTDFHEDQKPFLVLTHPNDGMSMAHYLKALEILG